MWKAGEVCYIHRKTGGVGFRSCHRVLHVVVVHACHGHRFLCMGQGNQGLVCLVGLFFIIIFYLFCLVIF